MTRVVLWRHGRTAYNLEQRMQGHVDIPLDDVGLWQAELAAKVLAQTLGAGVRIVSSDLRRASATAQALADLTGSTVVVDPRLRERTYGVWDGLHGDEVRARWPEEYEAWAAGREPNRPGAETRDEVAARVAASVEEHAQGVDELVVVSHGAAISLGMTALLELDPVGWRGLGVVGNAHWSELSGAMPGWAQRWRLTVHNQRPPVPEADWNSGIGSP